MALYVYSHPSDGTPNTILSTNDGVTWTTLPGSSSTDYSSNYISDISVNSKCIVNIGGNLIFL